MRGTLTGKRVIYPEASLARNFDTAYTEYLNR